MLLRSRPVSCYGMLLRIRPISSYGHVTRMLPPPPRARCCSMLLQSCTYAHTVTSHKLLRSRGVCLYAPWLRRGAPGPVRT
eukprot:3892960-Rhodomonas_salina.1